jgi:hypothetical protein
MALKVLWKQPDQCPCRGLRHAQKKFFGPQGQPGDPVQQSHKRAVQGGRTRAWNLRFTGPKCRRPRDLGPRVLTWDLPAGRRCAARVCWGSRSSPFKTSPFAGRKARRHRPSSQCGLDPAMGMGGTIARRHHVVGSTAATAASPVTADESLRRRRRRKR